MNLLKAIKKKFNATLGLFKHYISDYYTYSILILYSLLLLFFWNDIDSFLFHIVINLAIILLMLILSYFYRQYDSIIIKSIKKFIIVPTIFYVYSQTHLFVPIINPNDFDLTLIEWDLFLFGVNPTEWIYQFSHPILTEYLQFAYMTFFFLPLIYAIEIAFKKNEIYFNYFSGHILFGFYLSYLLYFLMPAIGPRFYIHDFHLINIELPGLWLTEFFRETVNLGGGVTPETVDVMGEINRDCMPSGHTMLTLINIYLAIRYKSKLRYIITIFGTSLIIATVYLRYHYVVDILAGIIFAIISIFLHNLIWKRYKNRK